MFGSSSCKRADVQLQAGESDSNSACAAYSLFSGEELNLFQTFVARLISDTRAFCQRREGTNAAGVLMVLYEIQSILLILWLYIGFYTGMKLGLARVVI